MQFWEGRFACISATQVKKNSGCRNAGFFLFFFSYFFWSAEGASPPSQPSPSSPLCLLNRLLHPGILFFKTSMGAVRPKTASIGWGLGFSQHQGRHWVMFVLCWHNLGFRGHGGRESATESGLPLAQLKPGKGGTLRAKKRLQLGGD